MCQGRWRRSNASSRRARARRWNRWCVERRRCRERVERRVRGTTYSRATTTMRTAGSRARRRAGTGLRPSTGRTRRTGICADGDGDGDGGRQGVRILEVALTTARYAQAKAAGPALYPTVEPARPPERHIAVIEGEGDSRNSSGSIRTRPTTMWERTFRMRRGLRSLSTKASTTKSEPTSRACSPGFGGAHRTSSSGSSRRRSLPFVRRATLRRCLHPVHRNHAVPAGRAAAR